MDTLFWFPFIKVAHLAGLVLWLGPSGGAWLLLLEARRRFGDPSLVTHQFYLGFLRLLWFQHLGVLLVLGSGILLLSLYGGMAALQTTWLHAKLALVIGIVVPIEIADIWFSHKRIPEIFASRRPEAPYTPREQRLLTLYHQRFVPLALPILLTTVAIVMWLAVAKPV